MTMYIYHAEGHPVGVLSGYFIHDLDGIPLGRIIGSRVHRLDGEYVGELFKETVVAKPVHHPRAAAPMAAPARISTPSPTFRRRGLVDYGYPDMFHRLTANMYEEPLAIAAE